MEMRRFGLLLLVLAAAAGLANPSQAYVEATSGTELVLTQPSLGATLWDLTIETDGDANAGGLIAIGDAEAFLPNTALCDPGATILICGPLDGDDLGDPSTAGNIYIILAVVVANTLNDGAGVQNLLGQIQGVNPSLTLEGLAILEPPDPLNPTGLPQPVTLVTIPAVPEPGSVALLGLGVASLAFLRRRAA
jgi:hypothetical protein